MKPINAKTLSKPCSISSAISLNILSTHQIRTHKTNGKQEIKIRQFVTFYLYYIIWWDWLYFSFSFSFYPITLIYSCLYYTLQHCKIFVRIHEQPKRPEWRNIESKIKNRLCVCFACIHVATLSFSLSLCVCQLYAIQNGIQKTMKSNIKDLKSKLKFLFQHLVDYPWYSVVFFSLTFSASSSTPSLRWCGYFSGKIVSFCFIFLQRRMRDAS